MAVKIRKEYKKSKIGPSIWNEHGAPTGESVPLDLLDKRFKVLQTQYDHMRDPANDLIWIMPSDGDTAFWIKRGDTYEVIDKVKPLKRAEQDKLVHAMKELIKGYTTGHCYNTMNPYVRPYVKDALKLLAELEGKSDYMSVNLD